LGARSETVILVYEKLKETIPSLGIVLDCCTKPSHDLGRQEYFMSIFEEMRQYLVSHGIKRILVACPNCYKIFARYGTGLSTATIYEILAESPVEKASLPDKVRVPIRDKITVPIREKITVHDPCAVRFEGTIHESVRNLIEKGGHAIEEMPHSGRLTLCCGEGGAVGALVPDFASHWSELRQEEAAGRKIITYCAGCSNMLGKFTPTLHVLDFLWEGETGRTKIAKPPLTYWKRLRLKRWFKKNVPAAVRRERTFSGSEKKKGGMVKPIIFLFFLAAAIATVKTMWLSRYLEQETLRAWIGSYGTLAPIVYMLIYTVAPVFFLPGLPITIVGGILFGPVWGVVYTIASATAGACVAFLVSRYLAREWVERQLKSPRWRRLDEGVDRHGWKVVAFTRLIPIFPFNLLNYAFGLTKIGFRSYAVTTFFCMLPACIAFIVFSSSLIDLIRGRISLTFVIGLVLVILVSVFPFFYRRYKAKSGQQSKKIVEL
jgi:uncharacterized membrane protein YdjX (TVP38/TMEM64 family)